MIRYLRLLSCLLLFLLPHALSAQQCTPAVTASTGDFGVSGGVMLSWTLGQVSAETRLHSRALLTEGFHQPLTVTVVHWENPGTLNLTAFPNPAQHSILLTFENLDTDLSLTLYSLIGQTVFRDEVCKGDRTLRIPLQDVADGTYLLFVRDLQGCQQGVYKIIKTQ
ncbi:MAG: T9SS type A sorting domain-containing protein [Bacteroidetes bacterium]|nr:T9SS type A sorting domain-containing protein [Bacteroidota bacterium]